MLGPPYPELGVLPQLGVSQLLGDSKTKGAIATRLPKNTISKSLRRGEVFRSYKQVCIDSNCRCDIVEDIEAKSLITAQVEPHEVFIEHQIKKTKNLEEVISSNCQISEF